MRTLGEGKMIIKQKKILNKVLFAFCRYIILCLFCLTKNIKPAKESSKSNYWSNILIQWT